MTGLLLPEQEPGKDLWTVVLPPRGLLGKKTVLGSDQEGPNNGEGFLTGKHGLGVLRRLRLSSESRGGKLRNEVTSL